MPAGWRKRLVPWAAAAACLALAACAAGAPAHGTGSRGGGVISLTQVSTLKSAFNRDNGHPRLVLIFSPT
jgi:hypothetical protein